MDKDAHYFCNICGGPPTYKNLIKRSSLQYLDEENQLGEHEAYDDYCNYGGQQEQSSTLVQAKTGDQDGHSSFCNAMFGYEARNISLKDIKWLGDAGLFTENDSADLPMVSPLGQHVDPQSGHFFYPRPYGEDPRSNILECNKDGFLVHDACLEIFKCVCRDTNLAMRPIDLRDFVSVMELGLEDRNRDSFDWGYGDTFSEGPRFEFEVWVPREDSEVCETISQR
ncbi:hypothetical protein BDV59DRAFT_196915 [Aspergillus ambiguus]|uniref:uncharacterized protein n=1 Tax=Aspergillus ambiguus TaxID=176160 RepID=UPI003CCDA59C